MGLCVCFVFRILYLLNCSHVVPAILTSPEYTADPLRICKLINQRQGQPSLGLGMCCFQLCVAACVPGGFIFTSQSY